jgi:hypothetical protein
MPPTPCPKNSVKNYMSYKVKENHEMLRDAHETLEKPTHSTKLPTKWHSIGIQQCSRIRGFLIQKPSFGSWTAAEKRSSRSRSQTQTPRTSASKSP